MKKWLALIAITALGSTLLWLYADSSTQNDIGVALPLSQSPAINSGSDTTMAGKIPSLHPAAEQADERVTGIQQRLKAEIRAALQQMQTHTKEQNLQQWLHQFWANCQKVGPEQCQQTLAQYQHQLSAEQAAWLQQLLAQYHDYQQLLGELVMDNSLDKPTQYDEVKKLRQRLFADDYDSLFGREEQWAAQRFAYGQLLAQRDQLDAAQRLEALFAQQQQLPPELQPLFSADLLYQQALDMLTDLPGDERLRWQAQLRQRYFGADAEQVAQHEANQASQLQQRQLYLQQRALLQQQYASLKQQLLADNASAGELQQWQQDYAAALVQLRQQHFGS
ncbi:lipase secretion chaperone [Rheinheimera gaetbuli]